MAFPRRSSTCCGVCLILTALAMRSWGRGGSLLGRQNGGKYGGTPLSPQGSRNHGLSEEERPSGKEASHLRRVTSREKIHAGTLGSRTLMKGPWQEGGPQKFRRKNKTERDRTGGASPDVLREGRAHCREPACPGRCRRRSRSAAGAAPFPRSRPRHFLCRGF